MSRGRGDRVAYIELSALVLVIECEEHRLHKGIGLASRRIVLMRVVVKEEKDLINRIPGRGTVRLSRRAVPGAFRLFC